MTNTITIEGQNNNYWGANIANTALRTANPALYQLYFLDTRKGILYYNKGFRKNY